MPHMEITQAAMFSDVERFARAVLLFHQAFPWTNEERARWLALTGAEEATTTELCRMAMTILKKELETEV